MRLHNAHTYIYNVWLHNRVKAMYVQLHMYSQATSESISPEVAFTHIIKRVDIYLSLT